jgi:hypothetical protein
MARTARQQQFVDEYRIDLSATKAATGQGTARKLPNMDGGSVRR